jgi:hypothetical protein
MIAITSISPNHKNFDSQLRAVKSWVSNGYRVISLNSQSEINSLDKFKEHVTFVPTNRTNEVLFKRPYVLVSAIVDYIKDSGEEYALVINSDIIIEDRLNFTQEIKRISDQGVIVMNRHDFNDETDNSKVYELGFDGFFINKKWLNIFPQSILCLGQCHWDFWLPYVCVLSKTKIFRLNEPYLFHKSHPVQYSVDNWKNTSDILQAELGPIDKNIKKLKSPELVADYVYKQIRLHFK